MTDTQILEEILQQARSVPTADLPEFIGKLATANRGSIQPVAIATSIVTAAQLLRCLTATASIFSGNPFLSPPTAVV